MFLTASQLIKGLDLPVESLVGREAAIISLRELESKNLRLNEPVLVKSMDKFNLEKKVKIEGIQQEPFYVSEATIGFLPLDKRESLYLIQSLKEDVAAAEKLHSYIESIPEGKSFNWDEYIYLSLKESFEKGEIGSSPDLAKKFSSLGIL